MNVHDSSVFLGMFMSFSETEDARKTSKSKIIRVYALDDTNGTGTPLLFLRWFYVLLNS